jgi:hypothetical protein
VGDDSVERLADVRTLTLEAYADTVIPGEKRWPGDRAIAGVSVGGGAVQAGALTVLEMPEGGMAPMLDDVVAGLNTHAEQYRARAGMPVDEEVPPFAALPWPDRTALMNELTALGHPEKELWTGLALFCYMAFDAAAHLNSADALAAGHPGLSLMGFATPDADGLWRFSDYSYRRPLARLHPDTDENGSLK